MKKIVTALMIAILFFSITPKAGATASPFTDVSESHWAYWDIRYLWMMEVIDGYGDGNFGPNDLVTRAQAAKIISSSIDVTYDKPTASQFTDVPLNHWSNPYVQPLTDMGVLHGLTESKFGTNDLLTRAQMAKILAGAFDLPEPQPAGYTGFSDVSQSKWYSSYIRQIHTAGITSGFPDNTYRHSDFVTRAQLAAFTKRAVEYNLENK